MHKYLTTIRNMRGMDSRYGTYFNAKLPLIDGCIGVTCKINAGWQVVAMHIIEE